jgi:ribonuclease R
MGTKRIRSTYMRCAEAVVRQMLEKTYVPLPLPRVAELPGVAPCKMDDLREAVDLLRMAGVVVILKKERLCLAKGVGQLAFGKIHFHSGRGPALFFPDSEVAGVKSEPLKVEASDAGVALHGDRILARILPMRGMRGRSRRDEKPARYAFVLCILERAKDKFVGTLVHSGRQWLVTPDDPRIRTNFLVPDPDDCDLAPKPRAGDCVMVRLERWDNPHMEPEGAITTVYGKARTPDAEYKSLLDQYDLSTDFPPAVEKQAEALPDAVLKADRAGRLDLRKTRIFTIDPDTAKDFDDALGIEKLENGGWRVGIHIADVSHYVRPGTALDAEARRRGNSTYLVGTVVPMLPHKLSSGLCSLVEGEDRLTKSIFVEFDAKGKLLPAKTTLANSVIRSAKRMSYHQAIAFLREDSFDAIRNLPAPAAHETGHAGRLLKDLSDDELADIQHDIRALWKLADRMRRERMFDGALDLDMPETAIHVDAQGYACSIEKLEYDESHQLVEEFMLAANEAIARELRHAQLPLIHRVHDKPDEAKLVELAQYLRSMGLDVHDLSGRKELCRALDLIHAHPQGHILRTEFLRSLKQACYRAEPDGHYGLNKTNYAHFTSPIRRYSDLIVHRVFDDLLSRRGEKITVLHHYDKAELTGIAEHLSMTEQNSTQAERDSVKIKLLEYMERECEGRPDAIFEAVVMDVRRRGIFIELEASQAYGMIPSSSLRDDSYTFDEARARYIGRRTGRIYRAGDSLRVVVSKVDRARRLIDFSPAQSVRARK